ncbi:MAG: alpha-amylase family glycosyl hydrolase [Kofleriaceae bacterium]
MRAAALVTVPLVGLLAACPGEQVAPGSADAGVDGSVADGCVPNRALGELRYCTRTSADGLAVVVTYVGAGTLDLAASDLRRASVAVDLADAFDPATQTFRIVEEGLAPAKVSYLLRLVTTDGTALRPLFLPMWVGPGVRYADFGWRDGIMYQVMTDRFRDGDPGNNLDNGSGTLAEVDDPRSRWQGGDFRGLLDKVEDGYFEALGINALWISSPLLNSHNSQPAVGLDDDRRFSSYHSYHPIVTGYTHADHLGYATPIETAFGTEAELHALVAAAHARGIRVIPDFVTNHVQLEAALYAREPGWFFGYNPCDGNWDEHRIDCWFTTAMPDFDYGGNPAAVQAVVDHALWLIQEFDFDGFRVDALKHMDDAFVRALRAAVIAEIETTVTRHDRPDEASVFYMVGESLGGWARYHVRPDMVQGQVDEEYYNKAKGALLTFATSVRDLAEFSAGNDTAYLTPQESFGQQGGFPGAVMGNFFGNHDQVRALTEASGDHRRLRLAQAYLMTSPGNIPMLYQGDDIGTFGGIDPDNRAMHRFTGLSADETTTLAHARALGQARANHVALRRGVRADVVVEDWYWVYSLTTDDEVVYVALNRDDVKTWAPPPGYVDVLGHCAGGVVPLLSACVFVPE